MHTGVHRIDVSRADGRLAQRVREEIFLTRFAKIKIDISYTVNIVYNKE